MFATWKFFFVWGGGSPKFDHGQLDSQLVTGAVTKRNLGLSNQQQTTSSNQQPTTGNQEQQQQQQQQQQQHVDWVMCVFAKPPKPMDINM